MPKCMPQNQDCSHCSTVPVHML